MKEKIYSIAPNIIQNLLITLFNVKSYAIRYGGNYKQYRNLFLKNRTLTSQELIEINQKKYEEIIKYALHNSPYYKSLYNAINHPENIANILQLPIIKKEDLRKNIDNIVTDTSPKMIASKTGGTTGKSLEVYYTPDNMQERFAMLDDFRSRFGYELGKKTAWFSGKSLLSQKDVKKKRFWKTDHYYKVRYYSTFHIKEEYLKYYVEDLIKFQPEYFVGFPSTILAIAKYGMENEYEYPANVTKAIFPTAETIVPEMRTVVESFFKTKMFNQYASSEGAPFIFECIHGNLHLELQSGVFEVLDEQNQPAQSGKLVVTSFTTAGTPLIRYDIGDSISLEAADITCNCGNNNPLVKEILGRIDDYIYSPENGKINLGNISNTLKDTHGILKFKVIQNEFNRLDLIIIVDPDTFNSKIEKKFIQNWRDRIGDNMILNLNFVDDIPVEKSGKYRIIENNIKHLID